LFEKWSHEEATQVFPEVIERAARMVSEAASEYSSATWTTVLRKYNPTANSQPGMGGCYDLGGVPRRCDDRRQSSMSRYARVL
jgi:hypothetical protein